MRIVIVDDDLESAEGLKRNINGKKGVEVAEVFCNVPELIEYIEKNKTDLVLMDVNMPNIDGIEANKLIKEKIPDMKIILITFFREREKFVDAIKSNCDGFLYKGHTGEEILDVINNTFLGLNTYESSIKEILSENYFEGNTDKQNQDQYCVDKLTNREKEIVKLITEGKKDTEIAKELFISEGYLRNSLVEIRKKLCLKNSKELAVWGAKAGL